MIWITSTLVGTGKMAQEYIWKPRRSILDLLDVCVFIYFRVGLFYFLQDLVDMNFMTFFTIRIYQDFVDERTDILFGMDIGLGPCISGMFATNSVDRMASRSFQRGQMG